jgi:hypothetical protein
MIVKTEEGYVLKSADGTRKLGGPYKTRGEAVQREKQVQIIKHIKKLQEIANSSK